MSNPKIARISLSKLEAEARQADDSPDLDPIDYGRDLPMIIIERVGYPQGEKIVIVDGYHRAAGMVNWASVEERPLSDIRIRVIDATGYDEEVVALAAQPGEAQDEAIAAIEAGLGS